MASIYVHVPFCARRCTYCDFYFVTGDKSPATFVRAAVQEIAHYASVYGKAEPIETVYFGGGTPSRLAPDDVFALLDAVRTGFKADALQEVTFEVNPDDLSADYLRALRSLGVDRLSIGVQSFFDADLAWMNRVHTGAQAEAAIEMAQAAGFDNFSIDLIFGLPEQPEEYWAANLARAVRLGAPHVSAYGLTVEQKTPLGKSVARGLVIPSGDDVMAARYGFTSEFLRGRGYEHYEIASFALPGRRAVHNARYWTHDNYLGIGPSAHSFWWKRGVAGRRSGAAHRWSNVSHLGRYEALLEGRQLPLDEKQNLSLDALANEYVMLRLRTSDGLDLAVLDERYGADLVTEKVSELAWLEGDGLVTLRGGVLRLTDEGKLVADGVTERLMLDERSQGL